MPENYDVKLTEREALIMQNLIERYEAIIDKAFSHIGYNEGCACTEQEYRDLRNKFF